MVLIHHGQLGTKLYSRGFDTRWKQRQTEMDGSGFNIEKLNFLVNVHWAALDSGVALKGEADAGVRSRYLVLSSGRRRLTGTRPGVGLRGDTLKFQWKSTEKHLTSASPTSWPRHLQWILTVLICP
jgi:hypothetical protein